MKNRKLGEALDQRQVSVCVHPLMLIKLSRLIDLFFKNTYFLESDVFDTELSNASINEYCAWHLDLQVIEDELRERVERLETRQATDDASLLILNRYWNQVSPNSLAFVYQPCSFRLVKNT